MHTAADDFELIRGYAEERNEAAFQELVDRHGHAVYSVCYRRLRHVQHAEDATQRTFEILLRKAGSIERVPIRPYLYRVATGCCADIRRAETRREKRLKHLEASTCMPTASKQTRLVIATMEAALEQLSATYREALELRYILEFSVGEVAESLKISIPAAKQRLVRGLSELRSQMARDGKFGAVALPSLFAMLQPKCPAGFADRLMNGVRRPPAIPTKPAPNRFRQSGRSRALMRIGGCTAAVAGAAAAVILPTVLSTKPAVVAQRTQSTSASPLLPPTAAQPTPARSLIEKLHRPYASSAIDGPELQYAIAFTSMMSSIPVAPDWDSIEAAGIPRTKPIKTLAAAKTDALSEFQRIVDAASQDHRLECVVGSDSLIIRARPSVVLAKPIR